MLLNNASDGRFIRFRGPDSPLMSAAQNYAVAPWEHVAVGGVYIIDLRLWRQERQLSFHRDQFIVIEERLRAESSAINDHLFLQLNNRRNVAKILHEDPPTAEAEFGEHCRQVNRLVDQHHIHPHYAAIRKWMLRPAQIRDAIELRRELPLPRKAEFRVFAEHKKRQPANPVTVSNQVLVI